jgi:large subunit ribosomal protein L15
MDGLHDLNRPPGSHRNRKRIGRGTGSGTGKTSGFGHKGSKARAGHHGPGGSKPHFEGGQMPLQRRLPKRGFTNIHRVEYQVVNLFQLEKLEVAEITPQALLDSGLIGHTSRPIKVLGSGELTRKITVSAHAFSKSAIEKIQGAGGSIEELG